MALFGRKRAVPLAQAVLTADVAGYVHEAVANELDNFRATYWTYFLGQAAEADRHIAEAARSVLGLTVADADRVCLRSYLLALVAERLRNGVNQDLLKLGGDAAATYLPMLQTLTVAWDRVEFVTALCQESATQETVDYFLEWVKQYVPHLARRLREFTAEHIEVAFKDVLAETQLHRDFHGVARALTGGSFYYEMVYEIIRQGQLDVSPRRIRGVVLEGKPV